MVWPAVCSFPCTGLSNTINLHIETSVPHGTEQVYIGNALHMRSGATMFRFLFYIAVFLLGIVRYCLLSFQISQFIIISFDLTTAQTVRETVSLRNLQLS
jgi:hypothetical protein